MGCSAMIGKTIARLNRDGHIVVGLLVYAVGSIIFVVHGIDADFVAFTTAVLGFLGGHAWATRSKSGDSDVPSDSVPSVTK
jgi:hypothetical protein